MIVARLTTIDNPHSPFDNFKAWYAFDVAAGYNTTNLLAKITQNSEELSVYDQNLANTLAIDEIVEENINGKFKKVTIEVPDP